MAPADEIESVLGFWFGTLDADGGADDEHQRRWFRSDRTFDDELRARFGALHAAVAGGQRETWRATPRGRLAYVLVLDQLSRNIARGTPGMYANDPQALAAAVEGIDAGVDRKLALPERSFLYMPLMHAEDLAAQDRCLALFAALADEAPARVRPGYSEALRFARLHRDIVARFGRFPHRNALLGRPSTAEEIEFLKQPNSSF